MRISISKLSKSILLLLCAAVGFGRAHAGSVQFSLPVQSMSSDHMAVRSWEDMKFSSTVHQKYDFSCGSAALATLLTYVYHVPVTEEAIFKSMYKHGNEARIRHMGFSLLDMKSYLARHGVPSDGYKASLSTLAALRVPAIALIDYRGYHHFVLIRGIDNGQVLISDPSLGLRTESAQAFEQQWSGIFFAITTDLNQARISFNSPEVWQAVPEPPIMMARFQIHDLDLPANGWQALNAF